MHGYIETLLLFYLKNPLFNCQLSFLVDRLVEVIVAFLVVQLQDLDITHGLSPSCWLCVQRHDNLFALNRPFLFCIFDHLTFKHVEVLLEYIIRDLSNKAKTVDVLAEF